MAPATCQCANRLELVPVRRVRIGSSRLACSAQGNWKASQFVRSLIGKQQSVQVRVKAEYAMIYFSAGWLKRKEVFINAASNAYADTVLRNK